MQLRACVACCCLVTLPWCRQVIFPTSSEPSLLVSFDSQIVSRSSPPFLAEPIQAVCRQAWCEVHRRPPLWLWQYSNGADETKMTPRVFAAMVRAVAAEQHEEWMKGSRYLNADLLREQIKPMKPNLEIAA